jgi:hypothetical protein
MRACATLTQGERKGTKRTHVFEHAHVFEHTYVFEHTHVFGIGVLASGCSYHVDAHGEKEGGGVKKL